MEDGYYHESVEFLQDSLETLSDSVAYGYEAINNFIKEYDPIKFPAVHAAPQGVGCGGCGGGGGGSKNT